MRSYEADLRQAEELEAELQRFKDWQEENKKEIEKR